MKGSTLHRSGLTRENMGVLANLAHTDSKKKNTKVQLNQYKAAKAQELDVLWGGINKSVQKVQSATKTANYNSPAVYLVIGFVAGVLLMCCIILVVSLSSLAFAPKDRDDRAEIDTSVIETRIETPVAATPVSKAEIKKRDKIERNERSERNERRVESKRSLSKNVTIIGEDSADEIASDSNVSQEKYIVKQGDTLNGIAYRFYGRYNEAKIQEIQKINNIKDPASLSIGQELVIPVSQDR